MHQADVRDRDRRTAFPLSDYFDSEDLSLRVVGVTGPLVMTVARTQQGAQTAPEAFFETIDLGQLFIISYQELLRIAEGSNFFYCVWEYSLEHPERPPRLVLHGPVQKRPAISPTINPALNPPVVSDSEEFVLTDDGERVIAL